VCVHEKGRKGMGEGGLGTKSESIVSGKRANGRTVHGEGEGGNRRPGVKRSRERKWIMIGFNEISTTNKTFPRVPQPLYHPQIS
jgi:hypothetical protein